eukprot:gene15233-biopygen9228
MPGQATLPYTGNPSGGHAGSGRRRRRCGAAMAKELGDEGAATAKVRADEGARGERDEGEGAALAKVRSEGKERRSLPR